MGCSPPRKWCRICDISGCHSHKEPMFQSHVQGDPGCCWAWTPMEFPSPIPPLGFPGATSGEEPLCQCRRLGDDGSLGREDPLEEDMATHSIILAWSIPWTEEPGGLQSIGSHRVRHDRSDLACMHAPPSSAVSTPPPCKYPFQVRRVEHTTQDCSGLSPPPCLPIGCPLLMRPIL